MKLGPKLDFSPSLNIFQDFLEFPDKKSNHSIICEEKMIDEFILPPVNTTKTDKQNKSTKQNFKSKVSKVFDAIKHGAKNSIFKEMGKINLIKNLLLN